MAETVSRKKGYVPDDDKDYKLCGFEIDEAENGVVINCRYKLTKEAEARLEKSRGDGLHCGYYGSESERHVFQDEAEAKAFVQGELNELWADKGDGDGDEGAGGEQE